MTLTRDPYTGSFYRELDSIQSRGVERKLFRGRWTVALKRPIHRLDPVFTETHTNLIIYFHMDRSLACIQDLYRRVKPSSRTGWKPVPQEYRDPL